MISGERIENRFQCNSCKIKGTISLPNKAGGNAIRVGVALLDIDRSSNGS